MKKPFKKGLGRGLDALFDDINLVKDASDEYFLCDIDELSPNPYQPRQFEKDAHFDELVDSVRSQGVLQPVVVREDNMKRGYQLIAGERRWRAAKDAGLKKIPVVVKNVSDKNALAIALVENIQRVGLNPVEEARALALFAQDFNLNQEDVAKLIGKDRSTVANSLRLLKLPEEILHDLIENKLSPGHARCLLSLSDIDKQFALRKVIVEKGLSVRQAEALLLQMKKTAPSKRKKSNTGNDAIISKISEELMRHLGTRVEIKRHGQKGVINVSYSDNNELERIVDISQYAL